MSRYNVSLNLVVHFVSLVIFFEGLFMLFTVVVSLIYHETITGQLLATSITAIFTGLILYVLSKKHNRPDPSRKEGLFIVFICWFVLGLVGTTPYLFTHSIPRFADAFFESISGFTTTGSSILEDIEILPKSILFWRAETHWIGGMGIIVLFLAVIPFLDINGINLFYSEISSVSSEKITSKIKDTARSLWLIYLGLTMVETLLLYLGKMPLFDSICHSFATIATGGFSTQNTSLAGYSSYIQYIVIIFMLLSGINFSLHVMLVKGRIKPVLQNEELRLYLIIILLVTVSITLLLFFKNHLNFEQAFRHSLFQVTSVLTATGFATADYGEWPVQATLFIGLLMLIGASSGSTGGGVKVVRHLFSLKKINLSFKQLLSPNAVNVMHYNGNLVSTRQISSVISFIVLYYIILMTSFMIMVMLGYDAATSFGSVTTCMGGIGPGFGSVGPVSNFHHLSAPVKYFLTFLMVVGRLEIYPVLIVFTRNFWRY